MPRTGRLGRWPPIWVCRSRWCRGSGGRSDWHRTNRIRGSCPRIRCSSPRSATSSGLYLDPPERALVLCVDEKTQIQALNRTQPVFPMLPGHSGAGQPRLRPPRDVEFVRRTGPDHRQGDRRAAPSRHRATEFLGFLRKIDAEVPADLDVHLVLDNASTHKTPAVKRWLTAHPRFVLHFTPTSSNMAEPRRTLVCRTDHQEITPRYPHLSASTQHRHPRLDRHLERQPTPLCLDQDRRPNPSEHRNYCTRINDSGH